MTTRRDPGTTDRPPRQPLPLPEPRHRVDLAAALADAAAGDRHAFAVVYDHLAGQAYGLALRILRDAAQAEEVTQEVMIEVWRTAGRYDPGRGSVAGWLLTITHRRAVDRVRAEQAGAERARRVATASAQTPYDEVVDAATARLEHQHVRRCLGDLTDLQREAITLAYYQGYTYREVAQALRVALPTVKTRMRDGLIRLRDCLGVEARS